MVRRHNVDINFGTPLEEKRLNVTALDFRDFADAVIGEPAAALQHHVDSGLLGGVDLIIGADVVYERTHSALAQVCLALLAAPETPHARPPCGIFMLNISRPYIREFVAGLEAAGLSCQIERVLPSAEMRRRLRQTHDGWGAGASFAVFTVTRATPSGGMDEGGGN